MIVLSTSSDADLTRNNSELLVFSKDWQHVPEHALLGFEHKWLIGSRDGCSCGFRHLDGDSVELGFAAPEAWMPEEADDIAATREVVAALKGHLGDGVQADCIDAWMSDDPSALALRGEVPVKLCGIEAEAFRFFGNYRFVFTNTHD
jgi:hypothetical protein